MNAVADTIAMSAGNTARPRIAVIGTGGTFAMHARHRFDWVEYGESGVVHPIEKLLDDLGSLGDVADAVELGLPRGQGIRFAAVEHVAHGEPELIEVVLDAEQLEGVPAVSIRELRLQPAQAGNLPRDVPGVGHHHRQRDDQADQKGRRGRAPGNSKGHQPLK